MLKIILYFLLAVVLCVFSLGIRPHIYKQEFFKRITKFLYVLLYRGYLRDNKDKNGKLFIRIDNLKYSFFLRKYEERGKIGIFLYISYLDKNLSQKVLDFLTKENLCFFIEEKNNKREFIVLDFKQDIESIEIFYRNYFRNLFKINVNSVVNFKFYNIDSSPYKIIGFEQYPDFVKLGIDITLPVVKAIWIIREI